MSNDATARGPAVVLSAVAVVLAMLLAGCSSGDGAEGDDTATTPSTASPDDGADGGVTEEATVPENGDASGDGEEQDGTADGETVDDDDGGGADDDLRAFFAAEVVEGNGTATVTFADGASFSTDITCRIGSRELAQREVLYTATTVEPARFDFTIYGDGGVPTGPVLTITDDDGVRASAGGPIVPDSLVLDEIGDTITGSATFTPGSPLDTDGEPRDATIEATCS